MPKRSIGITIVGLIFLGCGALGVVLGILSLFVLFGRVNIPGQMLVIGWPQSQVQKYTLLLKLLPFTDLFVGGIFIGLGWGLLSLREGTRRIIVGLSVLGILLFFIQNLSRLLYIGYKEWVGLGFNLVFLYYFSCPYIRRQFKKNKST